MIVAGFDEVGRGAWAGPLCVVGVALKDGKLTDVRDSKFYSPNKRKILYRHVLQNIESVSISWSSSRSIDGHGLAACLKKDFKHCASKLEADLYICDGTVNYIEFENSLAEPKADDTYPAVAAASIIAKALRDRYMHYLHTLDDRYGFFSHVGYGTGQHKAALLRHGPSTQHRHSFKGVAS